MKDVFILGGARTPMTEYSGPLKDLSALELGAIAARAAFERTGVRPEWVDHVVVGNVMQTSSDAIYGARHVGLKAGVPIDVPALTVNRLCGSGIQSAVSGAQLIQLGEADLVLAGGIESMSQAPHVIRGLRSGLRPIKASWRIRCAAARFAASSWRKQPEARRGQHLAR
jgi:acetyl-CoA acetyltransferase